MAGAASSAVCLVADFRRRCRLGVPQIVGEIAQMNKLFTQFGMTPADRSRVQAENLAGRASDPLENVRRAKTNNDIVQ
jgi:hypothetical protein